MCDILVVADTVVHYYLIREYKAKIINTAHNSIVKKIHSHRHNVPDYIG